MNMSEHVDMVQSVADELAPHVATGSTNCTTDALMTYIAAVQCLAIARKTL